MHISRFEFMSIFQISQSLACLSLLLFIGGCCCCGRISPPNFNTDGFSSDGTDDGVSSDDSAAVDGDASKEMEDARKNAQKALNAKGYGNIRTVNLQKDGTNWYVTGTAAGLDGGDVSYNVWFTVTRYEGEHNIKTTWAVKTVQVDGEVVYP